MSNGLEKKEERMLRSRLKQLEAVLEKRCLLGGRDASEIEALAKKIRIRLEPAKPDDLDAEAERLFNLHSGLDWFAAALKEAV